MEARRYSQAWLPVVLLLLPVVAGVGWWGGRASMSAPDRNAAAVHAGDVAAASDPMSDPAAASGATRPRRAEAPLPDLTTPLRDTWHGLKQRADAGEAGAACRLAAEMEFCDGIRLRLDAASAMLADHEAMAAPPGAADADAATRADARRRAITTGSERLLEQSRHCEGAPAFSPQDSVRYWRSAALGGHVGAMRHYAVGNAFRMNDTLDNLDALRVYRREAETIAQRAVAAGDLLTAAALASAYSPQRRGNRRYLLAQSVQPDAGRALALFLYVRERLRVGPEPPPRLQARLDSTIRTLEAELSPAALSQARAQAAAYPATTPVTPREYALLSRATGTGATANVSREECAPSPAQGLTPSLRATPSAVPLPSRA